MAVSNAAELARSRGLRAARLHAIKAYIVQNLGKTDLSAEAIAEGQRVTARYVHKLFEREARTLSQHVRDQRLARVHGMLTDVRHTGRTISDLAYDAGFLDLSMFNRAFRRRYGATPSDVRKAGRP
jgi:transcriptional regulator GlxA family with amidase domain